MIVNGKDYSIDELVDSLDFSAHSFKKVGKLMLTNYEIGVLEANSIDYQIASSLKDLMVKIQDVLDDDMLDPDDAGDLEYILETISERDYYENTKK